MVVKELASNKWIILLFNAIAFVLMAWLLPIRFEENDDIVMCMIANGNYSGTPDGHLVFINALFGWMLAGLYNLNKMVEWYTLSFCLLHVLAMSGIVTLVMRMSKPSWLKALYLLFLYVLWIRMVIAFQFTTTAGLLCFSGCLAMLSSNRKWNVLGVFSIFIASLIRFHAAALVGILFSPLFVVKALENRQFSIWILIVVLLSLLGNWADGLFYHEQDWAKYRAYNAVRGKIHDNPNVALVDVVLPDGVSKEDYQVFLGFEGDPQIMTLPVLENIYSQIKDRTSIRYSFSNVLQLQLYRIPLALLFFGYFAFIGFSLKSPRDKTRIIVLLVSLLLFVAFLVYLGITATLKNRVFLCMLLAMSYIMVELSPKNDGKLGQVSAIILFGVLSGLVVKYIYQDYKVWKKVRSDEKWFVENQWPLVEHYSGILYPSAFRSQCLSPFDLKSTPFQMKGWGWTACIPFNKDVLEKHVDLVDSDIMCLGTVNAPPEHILQRIEKNYDINVAIQVMAQNDEYALYKFVSK